MKKELHYEFINSQTGNVIAYQTLPTNLDGKYLSEQLQKKRAELATLHKLNLELIYWQDKDHPIQ